MYLGFILVGAGLGLASGARLSMDPRTWLQLAEPDALLKLAPAVVMCAMLALVLRRVRSPLALPALMLSVPVAFYLVLLVAGVPLDAARDAGWVAKPQARGRCMLRVLRAAGGRSVGALPHSRGRKAANCGRGFGGMAGTAAWCCAGFAALPRRAQPPSSGCLPCPRPQADATSWRFWDWWRMYNIHGLPPTNIYWKALPSQVGDCGKRQGQRLAVLRLVGV